MRRGPENRDPGRLGPIDAVSFFEKEKMGHQNEIPLGDCERKRRISYSWASSRFVAREFHAYLCLNVSGYFYFYGQILDNFVAYLVFSKQNRLLSDTRCKILLESSSSSYIENKSLLKGPNLD